MGHRGGERARTPRSPTRSARGLCARTGDRRGALPSPSILFSSPPPPPSLPVFHCWGSFPTHNAPGWACKLISRTVASRHRYSIISKHRDIQPNGKWVEQGVEGGGRGRRERGWYPDRAPSSGYVNQDQRSLCALGGRRVRNSRLWKDLIPFARDHRINISGDFTGVPVELLRENARARFRLYPLFAFKRQALRYIRYLRNDNRKITYV